MGFFDKKSSTNTTTNDYTTNLQAGGADNRVGGDNSNFGGNVSAQEINGNVSMTDYGAIEQGVGLAKGSLDFASNTVANAFTLTDTATTNALLFGKSAFQYADASNKYLADISQGALKANSDVINGAFENNTSVVEKALDSNKSAFNSTLGAVNNAIAAVKDTVKGANTSDSVQTIQYIAGAVVVGILGFVLFSKGNK